MSKLKVGIVGGTGYTGVELLRLLVLHEAVTLTAITSRSNAGTPVAEMFPNLRGLTDLAFSAPDADTLGQCDLVFFATPNGTAMKLVPALLEAGIKVIDLAADFRIKNLDVWSQWYGMEHACPDLVAEAVYGLPEMNRQEIVGARLVANPGCYPTAVTLGLLPLMEQSLVDLSRIIADCKSGVSGGGRGASVPMLMGESGESFKAYAVGGHRHWPEISQQLGVLAGEEVDMVFVPHLLPLIRGIHATLYTEGVVRDLDLQGLYEERFKDEPFVDVMPSGSHPETRSVRGANHCRMAIHRPPSGDRVVVLSVIDNLVKGAAGQAVQNMNIMSGLPEDQGLKVVGLLP